MLKCTSQVFINYEQSNIVSHSKDSVTTTKHWNLLCDSAALEILVLCFLFNRMHHENTLPILKNNRFQADKFAATSTLIPAVQVIPITMVHTQNATVYFLVSLYLVLLQQVHLNAQCTVTSAGHSMCHR